MLWQRIVRQSRQAIRDLTDKTSEKRHSSRGMQSSSHRFSNRLAWPHQSVDAFTQAPAPMSSRVCFMSALRACQTVVASKYRPSLYKDTACVKNTKTFASYWECRLLLLFILPITSPPAAQHEPPSAIKPHKHANTHPQAHTHSWTHT